MSEGPPLWLKAVLRAERVVGSRVESAVHSDTYFDVMARAQRSSRLVTDGLESISKRVLHLANIPAGTDVRRIRQQLARMERRLVDLTKELEDQRLASAGVSEPPGDDTPPVSAPPGNGIHPGAESDAGLPPAPAAGDSA